MCVPGGRGFAEFQNATASQAIDSARTMIPAARLHREVPAIMIPQLVSPAGVSAASIAAPTSIQRPSIAAASRFSSAY